MLKSREVVVLSMTLLGIPACGGIERGGSTGGAGTTSTQQSFDDLSSFSLEEISGLSLSGGRVSIRGTSGATLLILSSANTASGDSTVQIAAEGMPALTVDPLALAIDSSDDPPEATFHEYLREVEAFAAESEDPVLRSGSAFSALTQEPQTGSTRTFKVLSTMTSTAQYKNVKGTLRVTTPNLFVYVDADAPSALDDDDLEALADQFEERAIPLERNLFGTESDINGDGRITILMSCVTNGMSSSGGIVTGFFFPGDLFRVSSSNPASNEMEIFYTLVPDPQGKCGIPISHEFALDNILPGVLAHEYQHMISFNNHVLEGGGSTEAPWLNEGLSHLAEDLTGFGNENPSRVQLFLTRPATTPLVPPTSPRLAERGAAYLFLRYLYEQHPNGDQFVQKLLDGTETGIENVVRAFGGTDPSFDEFSEMVQNWSVALALSETGLSSSARYNYRARSIHPETGNYTGICLRCRTDDGRGTELAGPAMVRVTGYPLTTNLTASASNFFLLTDPPSDILIQSVGDTDLKGSVLKLKP